MRPLAPSFVDRLVGIVAPAVLAAALLQAGPVLAQRAPGWVDPPAKPDAGKEAAKPAPAKPEPVRPAPQARAEKPDRGKEAAKETEAAEAPARRVAERSHRRPRAAEIRRERLARRAAPPSEIDAGARDPRLAAWGARAQRLASDYLDAFSAPNAQTLAATPRFYGNSVRFHGRTMSTAALIAEKRRFLRRWPERRYAARDGSMRTACSAAAETCVVRAVMGFSAESPARGARSRGVSELSLTVSFADERPVIVAESSRVLRRGAAASSAAEPGSRG